jgi:OFA family oxalate/formate antiporter-like MFS transporter
VKWFPDKKGLITGLAVAGFGFGALIWVKFAGEWGRLIENLGVQGTWLLYGVIYLVAVAVGSIWMINPPDGYKPAGWEPPPPTDAAATGAVEFGQFEMLKTPQFYMIWFCFIAGAMAGLMVIGVIKLFSIDALQVGGLSETAAAAAAGTAMGVFYALANGLGRIVWGTISDSIGRRTAIFLMCLIQGIAMLTFFFAGKSVAMLYVWSTVIGFNFGGNFALYPAATADYFGNKNVGVNYGWMFTAYGVGGIVGPVLAGKFKDLVPAAAEILTKYGAWKAPFLIAGVVCIVAAIVILLTRKPKQAAQ